MPDGNTQLILNALNSIGNSTWRLEVIEGTLNDISSKLDTLIDILKEDSDD